MNGTMHEQLQQETFPRSNGDKDAQQQQQLQLELERLKSLAFGNRQPSSDTRPETKPEDAPSNSDTRPKASTDEKNDRRVENSAPPATAPRTESSPPRPASSAGQTEKSRSRVSRAEQLLQELDAEIERDRRRGGSAHSAKRQPVSDSTDRPPMQQRALEEDASAHAEKQQQQQQQQQQQHNFTSLQQRAEQLAEENRRLQASLGQTLDSRPQLNSEDSQRLLDKLLLDKETLATELLQLRQQQQQQQQQERRNGTEGANVAVRHRGLPEFDPDSPGALKAKIGDLEQQIQDLHEANEHLQQQQEQQQQQQQQQQPHTNNWTQQLPSGDSRLRATVDELTVENRVLRNEVTRLRQKEKPDMSYIHQELDGLRAELDQLRERNSQLLLENRRLSDELCLRPSAKSHDDPLRVGGERHAANDIAANGVWDEPRRRIGQFGDERRLYQAGAGADGFQRNRGQDPGRALSLADVSSGSRQHRRHNEPSRGYQWHDLPSPPPPPASTSKEPPPTQTTRQQRQHQHREFFGSEDFNRFGSSTLYRQRRQPGRPAAGADQSLRRTRRSSSGAGGGDEFAAAAMRTGGDDSGDSTDHILTDVERELHHLYRQGGRGLAAGDTVTRHDTSERRSHHRDNDPGLSIGFSSKNRSSSPPGQPHHAAGSDRFTTVGWHPVAPKHHADVRVGDFVKFTRQGGRISRGLVQFVGRLPGRNDFYIGVELHQEEGKHDGVYDGRRYFHCKANKGVFVAFNKLIMCYQSK